MSRWSSQTSTMAAEDARRRPRAQVVESGRRQAPGMVESMGFGVRFVSARSFYAYFEASGGGGGVTHHPLGAMHQNRTEAKVVPIRRRRHIRAVPPR